MIALVLSVAASAINVSKAIIDFIQGKKKIDNSANNIKPLEIGHGTITDLKIPHKIKIGSWHEVSARFSGSVNSGFFSIKIQDSFDNPPQWYGDYGSIRGVYNNETGKYVETGALNLTNGSYSNGWVFKPDLPLRRGKGKVTIGIFEDKDYADNSGQIIHHRPHITLEEREILLY